MKLQLLPALTPQPIRIIGERADGTRESIGTVVAGDEDVILLGHRDRDFVRFELEQGGKLVDSVEIVPFQFDATVIHHVRLDGEIIACQVTEYDAGTDRCWVAPLLDETYARWIPADAVRKATREEVF